MSNVRQLREGDAIDCSDEIRSTQQNRKFHAMLSDIAHQLEWAGDKMDAEDWKRLLLAAKYGQQVVPNPLDGAAGFVVKNTRRSRGLTVDEMSDFIMEIKVFAETQGVKWGLED